MTFVPKDVVFLPESTVDHPDRWVAMNVFAKTCFGLSGEIFRFLGEAGSNPLAAGEGPFKCWRVEYFSNEAGLLADPSRFRRNIEDWEELHLSRPELVAELKKHCILVDDEAAYLERFKPKRHLLDRVHFGNFHQQHGQHMALTRRKDPADWWMRQKFSEDQSSVRPDTLYGAIQSKFLERYAEERISEGMSVVDLGCGTGVYSNLMASRGATVLGIDPSEEYLSVARANAVRGAHFENMKIGEAGALDQIPTASADIIFMSDALLFYFVPFYPGQNGDLRALLKDIRRIFPYIFNPPQQGGGTPKIDLRLIPPSFDLFGIHVESFTVMHGSLPVLAYRFDKAAYVTDQTIDRVTPIDIASNTAGTPISVGSGPFFLAVSPDGKTVYVANSASGTVSAGSGRTRSSIN